MKNPKAAGGESGFALVLAILALMLLTFLGLTLATTTSTELQISNNYRWGQQALYNAEAGLEVARAVLAQVGDTQQMLPAARAAAWDPDDQAVIDNPSAGTPNASFPGLTRNFEGRFCDAWGYGAGYGQVMVDPTNPAAPYQDVRTAFGRNLTGTFTLWVRRDLDFGTGPNAGKLLDDVAGEDVVVTSEGTAPFTVGGAFMRANRAVRRLESRLSIKEGCRPEFNQESDTGMRGCDAI